VNQPSKKLATLFGHNCSSSRVEARIRVIEKKPPMAAISLGTDVDAPRDEKWKLQENTNIRSCGIMSDHSTSL
jgi:hypothetical protein